LIISLRRYGQKDVGRHLSSQHFSAPKVLASATLHSLYTFADSCV
jgi:hypothetical protein